MSTVLLVDDEGNIRRLLALTLKAAGFEVMEASSGAEALALANTREFDILVADVLLEDVDGPSVAQALIRKHPSLLVVFISGYPLDTEAACRRHPYCKFLLKPFPPRTLVSAIAELAEKRRSQTGPAHSGLPY